MVFPNGGRYTMYQNSGDGRFMAETMMMKELIPHIDATYRTIGYRKAVYIDGFSMGKGAGTWLHSSRHAPSRHLRLALRSERERLSRLRCLGGSQCLAR